MGLHNPNDDLRGSKIHGFQTVQDLLSISEEHKVIRWLKPEEILAYLLNFDRLTVMVKKQETLPESGTLRLFNRSSDKFFRKDGHKWKKQKGNDRAVETRRVLRVGDEVIQFLEAQGEDNPNFVRRYYYLFITNTTHGNIGLVHYRDIQESSDGVVITATATSNTVDEIDRKRKFHHVDTQGWDELVDPDDPKEKNRYTTFTNSGSSFHDKSTSSAINLQYPVATEETNPSAVALSSNKLTKQTD